MKNLANNTENNNEIVNTMTPAEKRKATMAAKKAAQVEAPKAEVETTETKSETPKEIAPKISKFEKITSEFCIQNEVSKEQLLGYLLRKSVNKKTNLNTLAENLMNDSFFNREKILSEIKA